MRDALMTGGNVNPSLPSQWASGHDETVEVNQRALIDKVLARYSGEFTVFRELLQNSDDAQSKAVEIRFETQAYLNSKSTTRASEGPVTVVNTDGELPDLKTANVCIFSMLLWREFDLLRIRSTPGRSRTTELYSEMKIGVD